MMRKPVKTLLLAALLLGGGWSGLGSPASAVAYYDDYDDYGDSDVFYQDLAPYGEWVEVRDYGRVWRPRGVRSDWRPYTDGRWEYTEYGWTWVADEPWGWAPYHYGRWFHEPRYGWLWVPGREWAPAWVVWRRGGGYIGWAPAPPRWRPGRVIEERFIEPHYCFIEERRFVEPGIHRHLVFTRRNPGLVRITHNVTNYTVVDNRVFNRSIHVDEVEKVTGHRIPRHRVDEFEQAVPRHVLRTKEHEKERSEAPAAEHERRGRRDESEGVRAEPQEKKEHGAAFDREPAESRKARRERDVEERAAKQRDDEQRRGEERAAKQRDDEQRRAAERLDRDRRQGERRQADRLGPEQGIIERHETKRLEKQGGRSAEIERAPVQRRERAPEVEHPKKERQAAEPRHEVEQQRRQAPQTAGGEKAEAREDRHHGKKGRDDSPPAGQPAAPPAMRR